MKKNLYYRNVFRRRSVFKEAMLGFFYMICSRPRLLLEVFIRRNFGERYFSFSTGIVTTIILAIVPILNYNGIRAITKYYPVAQYTIWQFLLNYTTWYLFLAGFVYMCLKRQDEVKRLPSVFDFARFSLSTGEIHKEFLNYKLFGKPVSIRTIETFLEPAFFFCIGLGLWVLQQSVGVLIVGCSICYRFSYVAAYYFGDNFIMDKLDEGICNQELSRSFIDGLDASETRGVNYYGRRPADPEMRRQLAESFIEDQEIVTVK